MEAYVMRQREMTPAQLFEQFHRREGLRNRISNALMAIALFEAGSMSKNITKYARDGLNISRELTFILESIERDISSSYPYTQSVLSDILTNRLTQKPDKAKLERYKKGFQSALKVFESIGQEAQLSDKKIVMEAEQVMEVMEVMVEIDQEIESTYINEESLYRAYFLPR